MTDNDTRRQQALDAIEKAEKAMRGTTSLGTWEQVRDPQQGRDALIIHRQTGDPLARCVYAADAAHVARWQPAAIKKLIARDLATLARHKSSSKFDDGTCSCGWEECPEIAAVADFWAPLETPREEGGR